MKLSPAQLKGRIKNIAKVNHADARVLLRLFMMECFLERLSASRYKDNFILKGGMLVTAMIGVAMRSTLDIDTTIRNANLSAIEVKTIMKEIIAINLDDGVTFAINDVSDIMDEMEYPGIRISLNAKMENLTSPIKIDISTGDAVTPRAVEFKYKLLTEDRCLEIWSYNIETLLAEKLQTILARGILNTRMRDFYDLHVLLSMYQERIDFSLLKTAFAKTCEKRGTLTLLEEANAIIDTIRDDDNLHRLWLAYQRKFNYATAIDFKTVIDSADKVQIRLKEV